MPGCELRRELSLILGDEPTHLRPHLRPQRHRTRTIWNGRESTFDQSVQMLHSPLGTKMRNDVRPIEGGVAPNRLADL